MPDEWADAASEMISAHEETRGKPQFVIIGKKKYRGIVSAIQVDNIPIDGGWDFGGAFTIQIPLDQFRDGVPSKNTMVKYESNEMRIYSTNEVNAMVEILIANIRG